MTIIYDFLKFLFNKSSLRTTCLIINLSSYLDKSDLIQLRDYFNSLKEYKEKFE